MSSNSRTLFGGETGNNFAAQSLVRKILASDDTAGIDLINQLIQRKKFEVLAEAGKIIKSQMEELLPLMKAIEKTAIDAFPSVKDTSVRDELTACYNTVRNKCIESFVPNTPELQEEGNLQILKDCASKLVPLAEQGERLAAVKHKIEDAVGDAALNEKLEAKSSCTLL
ncbi:TPA: hypothetical protein F7Z60_09760 [Legionella pneumophila]|nr:hypothetical protein [Legionella pneumophila]